MHTTPPPATTRSKVSTVSPVLRCDPLGFPWRTIDPFLFCVHHDDAYPAANAAMGPNASLAGRDIGQDFGGKDGWSMYHGHSVPGFPAHPHRGFETVTIVRQGLIDHSDSLGAIARFGAGDVQWLTAGQGVVHAEMFPLLRQDAPNPLELFQIWLNLPAANKTAAPHFTMFWADQIALHETMDHAGRSSRIECIAGAFPDGGHSHGDKAHAVLKPPPASWAAQPDADVAIWTIRLEPGAEMTLPAAQGQGTQRMLYFFAGSSIRLAGQRIDSHAAIELHAGEDVALVNGDAPAELLLLQGRPIGEAVVQHGPFVMNTREEIAQTLEDYRRTGFGGWPWPDAAPVHGTAPGRFAQHPGQDAPERPNVPQPVPAERAG